MEVRLFASTYVFYAAHNQVSKVDSKGTTSYTYDVLNRLQNVTEPSGKVTTYTFDAAGNRLTETAVLNGDTTVTSYTYNEQNRLIDTLTTLNSVTTQTAIYLYDNNGNVLTETTTPYDGGVPQMPQVTTNVYDVWNQLIQTTTPDNVVVNNAYNGEGYRTSKSVDGVVTNYLYEYDKVVLETDGSNNQKARNVYGTNLISRNVDGQIAYYLYNGHADVVALVDNTGTIVGTYYYDAFGNIVEQTGTIDNNITYAGYQYDKETGKYYLNARMYDPVTARFMQEDTYRGSIYDPLSLNLYTYCHNEPMMYTDPTGHINIYNGFDYDADKYGKDSAVYKNLLKATERYDAAVNAGNTKGIKAAELEAYNIRMTADSQKTLNSLGYTDKYGRKLVVDGVSGDNTKYAARTYQVTNGLQVDGIIGKQTYTSLISGNGKAYIPQVNIPVKGSNASLANSLPKTGQPNSTGTLYNPDGSVKQERLYGPDGEPLEDTDYNHGGVGHEFPHKHVWKDGERQDGVPVQQPNPENDSIISSSTGKAAGWAIIGTTIYWIVSEGSRVAFPPRNLVPVP